MVRQLLPSQLTKSLCADPKLPPSGHLLRVSHLNELLGRVPSLPLWAEVLWVKQQQKASTPSRPT